MDREEKMNEMIENQNKAWDFAEKLPCFKDIILSKNYSGEETNINLGRNLGDWRCAWDVYRRFVDYEPTNYEKGIPNKFLSEIYINSVSIYDRYENYGLEKIGYSDDVFYYDKINSRLYIEDEHVCAVIVKINEWVKQASSKAHRDDLLDRQKELKLELKEVREQLKKGETHE